MRIRIFTLATLLYLGFLWLAVHSFFSGEVSIELFTWQANFKIATWIILPVLVYILFTLCHFSFYGWRLFKKRRAINSDLKNFEEVVKCALLGLHPTKEFKTDIFDSPNALASALTLWGKRGDVKFKSSSLNEIYDAVRKVENGEVADLKRYGLDFTNEIFLQNELNRIKSDYAYALGLLLKGGELHSRLKAQALKEVATKGTLTDVLKFEFDKKELFGVVKRLANPLSVELDALFALVEKANLSSEECVELAKILRDQKMPNEIIAFFEKLKNTNANATESWAFLLYDFGKTNELREFLASSEEEFSRLKLLLFLKENNQNCSSTLLY